jgi:hypothetical protein
MSIRPGYETMSDLTSLCSVLCGIFRPADGVLWFPLVANGRGYWRLAGTPIRSTLAAEYARVPMDNLG